MLLPRILTAVIGIPVVLAAIHFGGVVFMAFTAYGLCHPAVLV